MMRCVNCGSELPEDTVFCAGCGARQTPVRVQPRPQANAPVNEPPKKQKSGKGGLIAVIAVLAALLLASAGLIAHNMLTGHWLWESRENGTEPDRTAEEISTAPSINLPDANVGDVATFGAYEQDNDTSNGKEKIEWIVLAKEDDKLLVVSRYALDCQPYHEHDMDVTWETCSLRQWLNGTFLDTAFSSDEQVMIQSVTVTADQNPEYDTDPGNDTTDKVFLLSLNEVNHYFTSNEARKCGSTDYAKAQGAYTKSAYSAGGKAACDWWLRSPGSKSDSAVGIRYDGSVYGLGGTVYFANAVRPALWINLGS